MALSGTAYSNVGKYWRVQIEWSATQNIPNNTSTITARLYWMDTGSNTGTYSIASKSGWIEIDGTRHNFSGENLGLLSPNQKRQVASFSKTVSHNSNGTKSVSVKGHFGMALTLSGTYYGSQSVSATASLNTIPRESKFTRLDSFNIGGHPTITISRYSSGFTHDITAKIGSTTIQSWSGQGLPTSLAFSDAADNAMYNTIKNSVSATMTVTIQTKNGSTNIGSAVSRTCTVTVPSNVVPTFSSLSASETVSSVPGVVGAGRYVQNLSKVKFTINGAAGAKYSTIKSYKITFNGQTWNSSTGTTGVINKSGSVTATATVTDSRGRSASKSVSVTLLSYGVPILSKVTAERAIAGGVVNGQGTYIKATTVGSVSALTVGGAQKNKRVLTINTRVKGTTAWTQKYTNTSSIASTFNLTNTIGEYPALTSYDVQIVLSDFFNTTTSSLTISTASATMSWGKNGVGIGKIHEKGALDVKGDSYIEGTVSLTGQIKAAQNQFINSTLGAALNLQNSDIEKVNGIFFNDVSQANNAEGLNFLKIGKPEGSINKDDYDNLIMNDGDIILNGVRTGDVLWSGATWMNGSQTCTPSKKLSACPNGWVLVWSGYTSSVSKAENWDWNYTYIHKRIVKAGRSGAGVQCPIARGQGNKLTGAKYVYIHDGHFTGNNSNTTGAQDAMVLREVLAW